MVTSLPLPWPKDSPIQSNAIIDLSPISRQDKSKLISLNLRDIKHSSNKTLLSLPRKADCHVAVKHGGQKSSGQNIKLAESKQLTVLWQHSAMVSVIASGPSYPGFHSQRSQKNFRGRVVDVAEVNQPSCLEESGQWLGIIDQTNLGRASGKLVLQKQFVLKPMHQQIFSALQQC